VHFAANALVGESMVDPGKYFGNNVGNGVKLLNAIQDVYLAKEITVWTVIHNDEGAIVLFDDAMKCDDIRVG